MKKYNCLVARSYIHSAWIEVEADNKEEAKAKALAELDDTPLKIDCQVEGSDQVVQVKEN